MSGPDPWDALDDEVDSDWEEVQVERSGDEAEEVEVSPEDEEYQLEEEFQDQLQEEFEELHHLEVEEEKGESDDEIVPGRESDLKLTDVPEDMREAVQGSLSLKRILNEKYGSLDETAKRRRLDNEEPEMEPERQQLLERWKLVKDPAARYVIQTANSDDVLDVKNTEWNPSLKGVTMRNGRDPKSPAEQVHEKFLFARERRLISGSMVNVIEAWKARWKLTDEDVKGLADASHKDLRYVMREYTGNRGVPELLEEARGQLAPEDSEKTEDALPDHPGLFTVSRFNRLELIDSVADALVVGDANLTFSALLANHREGLGHVGRLVATTFETIETLRERYTEIDQTIKSLEDKMSEVLHNVDATRLAVDPRFKGMENKFGAVYYNFPHAGVVQGFFDGHPFVRWRHENLMHLFFRALRGFVKKSGIVKARKIASSPRSLSPNASVQSTKPQPNWNGGTPGEVGPGTYNTDKLSLARAAGARFGASHRFSPPDRASSPGPGAYETSVRSLTKGHQFQRAAVTTSRPSIPDSSSKSGPVATPGPAAYDTVAATRSTKKRMPGYSMRGRAQETRETSPGPADYGGHYTLFS